MPLSILIFSFKYLIKFLISLSFFDTNFATLCDVSNDYFSVLRLDKSSNFDRFEYPIDSDLTRNQFRKSIEGRFRFSE
ncbi:hypothetical protein AR690_18835 [Leptospira interrogans serovar Lai]|nr:hypothetical protein AR690_18835 [Leptospira interrogans serovar Lai]